MAPLPRCRCLEGAGRISSGNAALRGVRCWLASAHSFEAQAGGPAKKIGPMSIAAALVRRVGEGARLARLKGGKDAHGNHARFGIG